MLFDADMMSLSTHAQTVSIADEAWPYRQDPSMNLHTGHRLGLNFGDGNMVSQCNGVI